MNEIAPENIPYEKDAEWHAHAACQGLDLEKFFPEERGQSGKAAKKVCEMCVVRPQCLEHALNTPGTHGIWGGTTERERRNMLKTMDKTRIRERNRNNHLR